jgi:hypothetical protein
MDVPSLVFEPTPLIQIKHLIHFLPLATKNVWAYSKGILSRLMEGINVNVH